MYTLLVLTADGYKEIENVTSYGVNGDNLWIRVDNIERHCFARNYWYSIEKLDREESDG